MTDDVARGCEVLEYVKMPLLKIERRLIFTIYSSTSLLLAMRRHRREAREIFSMGKSMIDLEKVFRSKKTIADGFIDFIAKNGLKILALCRFFVWSRDSGEKNKTG